MPILLPTRQRPAVCLFYFAKYEQIYSDVDERWWWCERERARVCVSLLNAVVSTTLGPILRGRYGNSCRCKNKRNKTTRKLLFQLVPSRFPRFAIVFYIRNSLFFFIFCAWTSNLRKTVAKLRPLGRMRSRKCVCAVQYVVVIRPILLRRRFALYCDQFSLRRVPISQYHNIFSPSWKLPMWFENVSY